MHFAIKPISAAVLIACGAVVPSLAGAQTVSNQSVTGSYSVSGANYSNTGAVVSSSTPYMFQSQPYGYAPLPGEFVYGNAATGQISSGAQAGGDESGRFDFLTNMPSPFIPFSNATSSIAYHATYTNNSAAAQSYDFHFLIDSSVLALYYPLNRAASASVLGSVRINNSEVWSTQATLSYGGYTSQGYSPNVFTQSGADIGYTNYDNLPFNRYPLPNLYNNGLYRSGGYTGSISLGSFNPGQSVDIDYMLQNTATTDGFLYYGGAVSYINDPFGVQGGNIAGIPSVSVSASAAPEVSTVPEPESISLMMAGLGLLAVRGRRRKVK